MDYTGWGLNLFIISVYNVNTMYAQLYMRSVSDLHNVHHYTKITVVRVCVCVLAGRHRKRANPGTKTSISLQTEVRHYILWLTDTASKVPTPD